MWIKKAYKHFQESTIALPQLRMCYLISVVALLCIECKVDYFSLGCTYKTKWAPSLLATYKCIKRILFSIRLWDNNSLVEKLSSNGQASLSPNAKSRDHLTLFISGMCFFHTLVLIGGIKAPPLRHFTKIHYPLKYSWGVDPHPRRCFFGQR